MKKLPHILASIVVALLVSACSSDDVRPPPAELEDFTASVTFRELWSTGVGAGSGERLPDLRPFVSGSQIWTSDNEGDVYAIDLETGDELAYFELERNIMAGPVGKPDRLYLVDDSGVLICLDTTTGELRWTRQLSSEAVVLPVVEDGKVVVLTVDGRIAAYGDEDGLLRWDYRVANEPALTLRGAAYPVVFRSSLIFGLSDGRVISLSLSSGELLWERRVASPRGRTELERLVDIDSDLLLQDNRLLSVAYQGRLVELRPYDGEVVWGTDASSYSNLALHRDGLVLSSPEGDLIAYRSRSGEELWRSDVLSYRYLEAPVVWGDHVLVPDFEGYVHAFTIVEGKLAGRFRPGDDEGIRAPMLVQGDRLLILSNDGDLSLWEKEQE